MTAKQRQRRDATIELFIAYIRGSSLRQLARRAGISFSALRYRFKRQIHPEYATLARRGLFLMVRQYLNTKNLRPRYREQIVTWFTANLNDIVNAELNSTRTILSERKLNELTHKECGRAGDMRDLFLEVQQC